MKLLIFHLPYKYRQFFADGVVELPPLEVWFWSRGIIREK